MIYKTFKKFATRAWKVEHVTLSASVLLCLLYNSRFWDVFLLSIGGLTVRNASIVLLSFIAITLLFNACLTFVSFRYVLKPFLVILFLCSAAANFFTNSFGAVIDKQMMQNVFETDIAEASELINATFLISFFLVGIIPAIMILLVKVDYGSLSKSIISKILVVIVSLSLITIYFFITYKTLAPAFRQHRELRYLLTPTNYITALNGYRKIKMRENEKIAPLGLDAKIRSSWTASSRKAVTVIVVGETARAENFSLNGYGRQTNPLLAARNDIFNFNNVRSCGTATAVSLPCVFSVLGREKYADAKARTQEGLLSVLKRAGFEVYWRDNNSGCKGTCDGAVFEDLSKPSPGSAYCSEDECYDERLLEGLPDMIRKSNNDMVIVLHQKGSHGPAYWKRYPENFARFGPVCRTTMFSECSTESIIAAYDNTILYTDHVINAAIEILKKQEDVDTSLLYFSDHGESLGEKNLFLHGAPYVISPIQQRHVPMLMWMSEGFRGRLKLDEDCLMARRETLLSHDNIFHSVLGLQGVATEIYNPRLDILKGCINEK